LTSIACTLAHLTLYCSHFTLGNPKKSLFKSIIHTYLIIYVISEENKLLLPYHHTWKISPHYLVKCKTLSSDWRWCCVPPHCAEIQPMSQQNASKTPKTRPYRGLVLNRPTHALVSLTASTLGCTKLIFIEPGAKINGQYYWDVLLTQKLLSAIRSIAGDMFVFHQDNAPAHRGRDRVELLRRKIPQFISPCGKPTVLTSTR